MDILGHSGGYRKLHSFTFASIIQLGTFRFCEAFLNRANDPCGRQFDQMTQSARSGRVNIAEGSERSATSRETEMKLTDVAKASLGELKNDYEMWLLKRGLPPWKKASPEARAVANTQLDDVAFGEDSSYDSAVYLLAQAKKFAPWLESDDSVVMANAQLILIKRALGAIRKQLEAQGETFKEEGGFREKLTAARVAERAKQEDAPACPVCGKPMVKRNSTRGPFWGCTGFSAGCRGTRPGEEGSRTPGLQDDRLRTSGLQDSGTTDTPPKP